MPISHCHEEHIKDLADAGVDFVVLNMDRLPAAKHEEVFKWLNKYGIEATVRLEKLMQGIQKLSDLYVMYKNLGAFSLNNDPENLPYLEMDTPYTEFKSIDAIECDTPLLVGCFEKKEGKGQAFTLVNMQDFQTPATAHVRFKADGKITLYRDGEPEGLGAVDGWYNVALEQGDRVFVTVD
jgi:hypothetical protein